MIGTLDPTQRKVTVIGGGFAGLLIAYRLDQLSFEVTLHEKAERPGGLIGTDRQPLGLSEQAAHSFIATPAVVQLCRELGVELIPLRDEGRARYIYRSGRLRKTPLGLWELVIAFFRSYFALADRHRDSGKQSLAEWGN